ncbi:hypothetical protein L7F22_064947 [Adiantum nelumboides]|nr:hypothetical protein [Adiantum nelumboides]
MADRPDDVTEEVSSSQGRPTQEVESKVCGSSATFYSITASWDTEAGPELVKAQAQLIEVANTGNGLLKGEDCEFNTGVKEGSCKKNSAKKYFLKEAPKETREPAKTWKSKATAELTKGPAKMWKRPFARKSEEQKQVLRSENKCFICEQPGHIAPNCPQRKRPADSEDKEDKKGKKPMANLVPDMVGDKANSDASELYKAWGKVRDQTILIFFDPGAKANFISPELASKLESRSEEMGYTAKAGLACPGHTEAVTPVIGKLRLHIQSYVDAEELYIMPLDGCDVLLGIPWMFRVQGITDAYNKKLTVQSRGKTHILDVKLKRSLFPLYQNHGSPCVVCRVELTPFGVEVIVVAPGAIKSNIEVNAAQVYDSLPKWKFYRPWELYIKKRMGYSQQAGSTSSEEFAEKTVKNVLNNKPPRYLAVGFLSAKMTLLYYLPLFLRDLLYRRMFGLQRVPYSKAD